MQYKTSLLSVLATLLLLTGNLATTAQEDDNSTSDTTRVSLGDLKVILIDSDSDSDSTDTDNVFIDDGIDGDDELTHWGGVDLGANFLMTPAGDMNFSGDDAWLDLNNARSLNWSINMYEEKIKLVKNYVGIITGLGIGWSSYTFRDSVHLQTSTIGVDGMATDSLYGTYNSSVGLTKNKLRVSQLKIPVLLEINTSLDNERSFHIAAGVIGNWNFSNVYKQEFEEDGFAHEHRAKGDFHIRQLSADAMVRVGYSNFTLFAQYGLQSLFNDNEGPEVYPVTVGLNIAPW